MCNGKLHRFAYTLLIFAMLVILISPVLAADSGNSEANESCGTADLQGFNNSLPMDNETLQSLECSSPVMGKAQSAAFASSYSSCVGDGRGLMEIHAPPGSVYAARGPWGWFAGTDANGNPNWRPTDANGDACVIVDVCGSSSGQWEIRVKLPDGTIKSSGIFVFSQYPGPAGSNARCYYLFDVTPEPEAYTYSLSCIENYDNIGDIGGVITECDHVKTRLDAIPGWQMKFYHKDDQVTPYDFGTSEDYHPSLVDSTFYYYSGHGVDALDLNGALFTVIAMKNYKLNTLSPPLFYDGGVNALDVRQKWGGKNKWIMLQSCKLLSDRIWDNSLTTSHGILGYSSDTGEYIELPNVFFDYAINKKYPVISAYRQTTMDVINDERIIASVIVKTDDQYNNEQFPGVGYMAQDGTANDDPIYRSWSSKRR